MEQISMSRMQVKQCFSQKMSADAHVKVCQVFVLRDVSLNRDLDRHS